MIKEKGIKENCLTIISSCNQRITDSKQSILDLNKRIVNLSNKVDRTTTWLSNMATSSDKTVLDNIKHAIGCYETSKKDCEKEIQELNRRIEDSTCNIERANKRILEAESKGWL